MKVITVSRQLGSQGDQVALQVAERLGWRRVCRDLINRAALTAGVPHVALADIDELGLLGLKPSAREWQAYQRQVERIIRDLARAGRVVIVGRGGQMVLANWPGVLHVRIIAPWDSRVANLQQARHVSAEAAAASLVASDRAQARYLRRSYGVQLGDPALYHLVLNTGRLNPARAVDLIVQTFREWVGPADLPEGQTEPQNPVHI